MANIKGLDLKIHIETTSEASKSPPNIEGVQVASKALNSSTTEHSGVNVEALPAAQQSLEHYTYGQDTAPQMQSSTHYREVAQPPSMMSEEVLLEGIPPQHHMHNATHEGQSASVATGAKSSHHDEYREFINKLDSTNIGGHYAKSNQSQVLSGLSAQQRARSGGVVRYTLRYRIREDSKLCQILKKFRERQALLAQKVQN